MEDDVIRGATAAHMGAVTYPPPPPKIAAIAAAKPKEKAKELTPEERRAQEVAAFKAQTRNQVGLAGRRRRLILLACGALCAGQLHEHFIVFVLSVFVGFQVIWNVSHSLAHAADGVTNAISSIIILGALMQIGSGNWLVILLAALSVFMAGINIFGGFMVTRRMLAMFQKS
jgi:H+-translocating NAD(P) transhydrogenase subunit alpha